MAKDEDVLKITFNHIDDVDIRKNFECYYKTIKKKVLTPERKKTAEEKAIVYKEAGRKRSITMRARKAAKLKKIEEAVVAADALASKAKEVVSSVK